MKRIADVHTEQVRFTSLLMTTKQTTRGRSFFFFELLSYIYIDTYTYICVYIFIDVLRFILYLFARALMRVACVIKSLGAYSRFSICPFDFLLSKEYQAATK